jgi:hypothetical protein
MEFLGRIITIHLVHRALSFLTRGFREGIETAAQLSRAIGELQTITQEMSNGMLTTARSTGEWSNSLLALSTSFGVPVLEVTEALYQGISNQVITAKDATAFLTEEFRLATATASTLNQAVEVTSSVIQAYKLNATDAASMLFYSEPSKLDVCV